MIEIGELKDGDIVLLPEEGMMSGKRSLLLFRTAHDLLNFIHQQNKLKNSRLKLVTGLKLLKEAYLICY